MYRKIHARFPGKCAKCGNPYPKGEVIFWEKGNRAVFHSLCFGSKSVEQQVKETPVTPAPSIPAVPEGDTLTLDIAELKALTLDVIDGKQGDFTPSNFKIAQGNLKGGKWEGWTQDDLRDWIRSGYKSKAFQNLQPESPPIRKKRKLRYSEEGELQIDLALSGFDYPFLEWSKREAAPGLSVDVQFNFLGSVDAAVIEQYQVWTARLLYTLEQNGFDLDVNVFSIADGYIGSEYGRKGRITINVKREGKASAFNRWSVILSPAGFRGMIFAARAFQCSKLGVRCDSGMGKSVAPGWRVDFEPKSRKLTIRCDARANDFPEQEMDLKVRAFLTKFH